MRSNARFLVGFKMDEKGAQPEVLANLGSTSRMSSRAKSQVTSVRAKQGFFPVWQSKDKMSLECTHERVFTYRVLSQLTEQEPGVAGGEVESLVGCQHHSLLRLVSQK